MNLPETEPTHKQILNLSALPQRDTAQETQPTHVTPKKFYNNWLEELAEPQEPITNTPQDIAPASIL